MPVNEISLLDTYERILGKCCIDPLRPPRLSGPTSEEPASHVESGQPRNSKMFPVAPIIVVIVFGGACVIGAVFGVLSGLLSAVILRLGLRGAWKDALLGAIAVPIGFFLAVITPLPQYTIYTPIGGGGEMEETVSRFQHPFLAAFILAAILPALRNLYRLRQSRKGRITAY
jgi:hypothetical protein